MACVPQIRVPFPYFQKIEDSWKNHVQGNYDAIFLDDIIDGCGFEIIKLSALKKSHIHGDDKHRSELCTLFIRENEKVFKINRLKPHKDLIRRDLRLTVDNPEDLVVCRKVYNNFSNLAPFIPISDIVKFLDENEDLKKLVSPFTEEGYASMYL